MSVRTQVLQAVFLGLLFPAVIEPALSQDKIEQGGRRIVGGEPTQIENHPWQVAINISRDDGVYLCGGSIVARRWILTAAHCLRSTDGVARIKVKSGVTNYLAEGFWIDVERFVIHDRYNPQSHEFDLAMLALRTAPSGMIIPLAQASSDLHVSEPLTVTGWGATLEGGKSSKTLLRATVPYVRNVTCNGRESYNGRVLPTMMCAGREIGGVDSCQGDSGGPLVRGSKPDAVLVGVVSFGDGCARELKYGVYTRVGATRDWIISVIKTTAN